MPAYNGHMFTPPAPLATVKLRATAGGTGSYDAGQRLRDHPGAQLHTISCKSTLTDAAEQQLEEFSPLGAEHPVIVELFAFRHAGIERVDVDNGYRAPGGVVQYTNEHRESQVIIEITE